MPGGTIKVKGLEDVIRNLKDLEPKLGKKLFRQALRKGMKPVASAAKALAPRDTGALAQSIKVRAGKRSKRSISIVVSTSKGQFKGNEFYGGQQEFGWKAGKRGSEGRKPIEGKHFMERAFEEKGAAAGAAIVADIKAGFDGAVGS